MQLLKKITRTVLFFCLTMSVIAQDKTTIERHSKLQGFLWKLSHIDDIALGATVGSMSALVGIQKKTYDNLKHIIAPQDIQEAKRVANKLYTQTRTTKENFVIISDLHLLGNDSPHDYVSMWRDQKTDQTSLKKVIKNALKNYAQSNYTLVLNGDIEDLLVINPSNKQMLKDSLYDLTIFFGEALDRAYERKLQIEQLERIGENYSDLYTLIRNEFYQNDRLVQLVGNHDIALKDDELLRIMKEKMYGKKFRVFDYLFIKDDIYDQYPAFIVAHGHQFDPWSNEAVAPVVSESFTYSLAWYGNGADRIWDKDGENGWLHKIESGIGFDNKIVSAPSFYKEKNETTKFRHMGEASIARHMKKTFEDAMITPKLVLGHTHEPRLNAINRDGSVNEIVLNSGTAGRYQQLMWALEIIEGTPHVVAWYINSNNQLIKIELISDLSGKLKPFLPSAQQFPLEI